VGVILAIAARRQLLLPANLLIDGPVAAGAAPSVPGGRGGAMTSPAIVFDQVKFAHAGAAPVLETFSLTVEVGDVQALVGRSGAGKTTVLKLINRLLLPTTGSVHVQGRDTRDWDGYALRRRTGYVLQEVGLFPHMTIEQNVGLVPRLENWPAARIRGRVRELLELVGLAPEDYGRRWPHELSGGERQRVGVARALAADPPILLMDEPFGALDPVTRAELHAEFTRIQAAVRKTVVLVTHDMAEAFALATRLGVLHEGTLLACDRPAAIQASDDPRVRRFVDAVARR
jgi:osmoprotectant transport system ATP-binding protein